MPVHLAFWRTLLALSAALLLGGLSSCSTKKNTATSRWWQSFVTRYNVYFNASEAYKDGVEAQEAGHKDNYTELLPLYISTTEATRSLGSSSFATAIEKSQKAIALHSISKKPQKNYRSRSAKTKAYLARREFNPFLKNAWLLMAKSQFQQGEFIAAASSFSYITRHYATESDVVAEARLWLARCYAALEWYYDADDVLDRVSRDSLPSRLSADDDATRADLLLRQERCEEALPYLENAARKLGGSSEARARRYFILAQAYQLAGCNADAYKALQKCISKSPSYGLQFNARILQTEVLSTQGQQRKMISRLKRMARSSSNQEYLDQVYYAMGNIYLSMNDTAQAVSAYEKGRNEGTRQGIERGVLLLRLGELYWELKDFTNAQGCYNGALSLIGQHHKKYKEASARSAALDELVPYTSGIELQDSLLALSEMNEEERNEAIDRVIESYKKKQKEEAAKARKDSLAAKNKVPGVTSVTNNTGDDAWYFYNTTAVAQGKQSFQRTWGNRANEDDWRRSNKTVVRSGDDEEFDYALDDSLSLAVLMTDSLGRDSLMEDSAAMVMGEAVDPDASDPTKRAYYLAQIPMTDEAKTASHAIIEDGLFHAGVIFKDKIAEYGLAEEYLFRLLRDYPESQNYAETLYHLFLLYSRLGDEARAELYRKRLINEYPDHTHARRLSDPDYEYYAAYAVEIEDSLYQQTYEAFLRHDVKEVGRINDFAKDKFPTGANRPKFMLVHALSLIGTAETSVILEELKELLSLYPKSDVSEMAGMIVKGIESGRLLTSGFDMGSLWALRFAVDDSIRAGMEENRTLSPDRYTPFLFLFAYPTDSVDRDLLLYDIARFNFTGFVVRSFPLQLENQEPLTQFVVGGFHSYDEALAYARRIWTDPNLASAFSKGRVLLISEHNYELLGREFSYDDYSVFFEQNYAPLEVETALPLDLQTLPETQYEDEQQSEEVPLGEEDYIDEEEFYFEDLDQLFEDIDTLLQEMETVPDSTDAVPDSTDAVPDEDTYSIEEEATPVQDEYEEVIIEGEVEGGEGEIIILDEETEEPEEEVIIIEEEADEPKGEVIIIEVGEEDSGDEEEIIIIDDD